MEEQCENNDDVSSLLSVMTEQYWTTKMSMYKIVNNIVIKMYKRKSQTQKTSKDSEGSHLLNMITKVLQMIIIKKKKDELKEKFQEEP